MMSVCSTEFLRLCFAFILAASVHAESNSCKTTYFNQKIDWSQKIPNFGDPYLFEIPGVIVSGQPNVTFREVMNFTGMLWNADSFQELSGLVCSQYGPYIYAETREESVVEECDKIVTALSQHEKLDVYKDCIDIVTSLLEQSGVNSLIADLENDLQIYDGGCQDTDYSDEVGNTSSVQCVPQAFKETHSTDLIELVSRLFFSVLDWLGPSPFSGDAFGACSGLRLLVDMKINEIEHQLKLIASYVVADGLKRLNNYNSCYSVDEKILEIVNYWLFPDQIEDGVCELLKSIQSDEEYRKVADDILKNLPLIFTNEDQCLNILVSLDELIGPTEFHYMISGMIGFNIANSNDRQTFCTDIATSLSSQSTYSPSPYTPSFVGSSSWQPLPEPGELLPGFTIKDAFDVIGAFLRSDTLADGAAVLCTVFGPFSSQLIQSDSDDVSQLCEALQDTDAAAVEQICRDILVPLQYPGHPTSLRIPTPAYMIVTGVDMFRRLLKVEALSPELGCTALDSFLHNDAPQAVARFSLEAYFAELLPIAHDFCENYTANMMYLMYKANMNSEYFLDFTDTISGWITTHMGFESVDEMCAKISDGIKEDSGRASHVLVSSFSKEALKFLADEERCIASIDEGKKCLKLEFGEEADVSDILYTLTGYKTTDKLCKDIVSSFNNELCWDSSGDTQQYRASFLLTLVLLLLSATLFC